MSIDDLLFGDGDAEVALPTAVSQPLRVGDQEHHVLFLQKVLEEVFPSGFPLYQLTCEPLSISRKFGNHTVAIIRRSRPGGDLWMGEWRTNVTISAGRPRAGGGNWPGVGATIEKATRVLPGEPSVIGWLSWVHQQICKESATIIRTGLHPDRFLEDPTAVFRAAYDLHQIKGTWEDVADKILTGPLLWKHSKTGMGRMCDILRTTNSATSSVIGTLGVQLKDGFWRYGGKLKMQDVNAAFALSQYQDWKFTKKEPEDAIKDFDEACDKAHELYAHKVFDLLMEKSPNPGFRQLT